MKSVKLKGKSQFEKYIETKIWNSLIKGKPVIYSRIVKEANKYFKINKIKFRPHYSKIKHRVTERFYRHQKRVKRWSETLHVPEDTVMRWFELRLVKDSRELRKIKLIVEDIRRLEEEEN